MVVDKLPALGNSPRDDIKSRGSGGIFYYGKSTGTGMTETPCFLSNKETERGIWIAEVTNKTWSNPFFFHYGFGMERVFIGIL